jgi:hypothetical protein
MDGFVEVKVRGVVYVRGDRHGIGPVIEGFLMPRYYRIEIVRSSVCS